MFNYVKKEAHVAQQLLTISEKLVAASCKSSRDWRAPQPQTRQTTINSVHVWPTGLINVNISATQNQSSTFTTAFFTIDEVDKQTLDRTGKSQYRINASGLRTELQETDELTRLQDKN